jgi:Zn finger protein HypA/HybF involved in hydrogenase expression
MAITSVETFRCMMCGHEYTERVAKGEDKERSCPKCRSNSIRHLKGKAVSSQQSAVSQKKGSKS